MTCKQCNKSNIERTESGTVERICKDKNKSVCGFESCEGFEGREVEREEVE